MPDQEEFQRDVNMTYLARIHFAGGGGRLQSETGPNMSRNPTMIVSHSERSLEFVL